MARIATAEGEDPHLSWRASSSHLPGKLIPLEFCVLIPLEFRADVNEQSEGNSQM